jgi:RNA polymerase sigma-70 factor (ECF subfamily)
MSAPFQISATDPDDAAMTRLAAGDDSALDELMGRWSSGVIDFLMRLTGNHATACDLAQETFVRLYQARERYRPSGTFRAFLYKISSNLARNHARWRSRRPEISADQEEFPEPAGPEHSNPLSETVAEETAEAVRQAILALPVDLRAPLVLSVYEGQKHREIASVLGCSAKAVEMRIYKARQILRGELQEFLAG